jgi:hypothetical protein
MELQGDRRAGFIVPLRTLPKPIQTHRITNVRRFKASQFRFIQNRGYCNETPRANGIVSSVVIVSMWEAWL